VTPRLAPHVRLKYWPARDEWLLVLPEAVVTLNETASDVLRLCDGERDLDAIVAELSGSYEDVDKSDVDELLRDLAAQRLVELS